MNWQLRAGRGGVCDFRENYDFYFKWLTGKVMSCFTISDNSPSELTSKINWDYFKLNLIQDGQICITDFGGKLYACIGNRGGAPDEYYLPTRFIIANPVVGSKEVKIGEDGIVIYNAAVDQFNWTGQGEIFSGGLYGLISQTATLCADNIISISCVQINARVSTFFTADSEAQAVAGEAILKKQYAGKPYQILRSDLIEKINVNPVNTSAAGQNITELIELNNYLISSFFQNIGIKSNNVMKRERLISDEVDSQLEYLQVNVIEMLSSWQKGLDAVNELYGTDFTVKLNPIMIAELISEIEGTEAAEEVKADGDPEGAAPAESESDQEEAAAASDGEPEAAEPEEPATEEEAPADVTETIEDQEEIINDIVDIINDNTEGKEEEENDPESESEIESPDTD